MSQELSELMKLFAEERSKRSQHLAPVKDHVKSDLNGLFEQLAEAKASDPNAHMFDDIKARIASDISGLFEALEPVAEEEQVVEQVVEPIVEEVKPEPTPEPVVEQATGVEKYAEAIKEAKPFAQPDVPKVNPEFKAITDKLKFLEQWVGKISAAGPGSGEVNFRYLDDVARATMNPENDNWVLEYDSSSKKVQFTENVGPIRTLGFNTAGYQTPLLPGQLGWNVQEDCLDVKQSDGSTLQLGLEHYFQIHNGTGTTLLNGEVVMFSGVDLEHLDNPIPMVSRYAANSTSIPLYIVGVMTNDVPNGGHGRATVFGKIHDLNTTGSTVGETWAKGDLLWAHPTQAGKLTKVRPTAPNVATSIAAVLEVSATDGVILVRPTIWPRLFYGDWYDDANQTAALPNTAYAVKMLHSGAVSGFEVVNNQDIKALNAGRYNFEFSLQVTSTNSSLARMWIWYRKNGVDVPNSATVVTVRENGGKLAPSWNFPVLMDANDTFTLMWATESTNVSLAAEPATAFCPSIPSVILTVGQTNL